MQNACSAAKTLHRGTWCQCTANGHSRDEPLALALRDALQPPYEVFVYSKAQEHLAGRDGVEAFRTVFRERATLAVILYGLPWGETPWTRVEKIAIEEFALGSGWEHLLFVRLRSDDTVPKWLPKPHLHLDLVRFGLPDLVGAIKLRLAELGTEARPVSPAQRAAAQERRRQFDAETVELLRNSRGTYEAALNDLLEALKVEAATVAQTAGWEVGVGDSTLGGFAIVAQGRSLRIVSNRRYVNSIDDTHLQVLEYSGPLTIAQPGQQYWVLDEPHPSGSHRVRSNACRSLDGAGKLVIAYCRRRRPQPRSSSCFWTKSTPHKGGAESARFKPVRPIQP